MVREEEGDYLNFEFTNSLHLLEDQHRQDGHGAWVTYEGHTQALLSLLFVDIHHSAICKQDRTPPSHVADLNEEKWFAWEKYLLFPNF